MNVKETIKDAAFHFYGMLFSVAAKLPVKENRVVLFSLHDANFTDGLGEIEKELRRRGGYDILRVDRQDLFRSKKALLKFFFADNLKMARAKTIFLNNNFFPMNYMTFNKDTTVVQVWHGQGVFKKFGLDIPQPPRERRLEQGVYQWPRSESEVKALTPQQYRWLMEGLQIEQPNAHRTVAGLRMI